MRNARSESPFAVDYPMSRDEKKNRVLKLYDQDARQADAMLRSGEEALESMRSELQQLRQTLPSKDALGLKTTTGFASTSKESKRSAAPRSEGSAEDVSSSPERDVPKPLGEADAAIRKALSHATTVLEGLLETRGGSSGEGESKARAKSEGNLRNFKDLPPPAPCRRRRRSRPDAPPRHVCFSDDVQHDVKPSVTPRKERPPLSESPSESAETAKKTKVGQPKPSSAVEESEAETTDHDDSGIVAKNSAFGRQDQSEFGILAGIWSIASHAASAVAATTPRREKRNEDLQDMQQQARDVFVNFLLQLDAAKDESLSQSRDPMQDAGVNAEMLRQIIAFFEAISKELTSDEIALWDAFAHEDMSMCGVIDVRGPALPVVLRSLSLEDVDACVAAVKQSLAPDHSATFVDLLDWWAEERKSRGHMQQLEDTFMRSLRLFSLMPGAGQPKSRLREVAERYAWEMDTKELLAAAHSAQRTLVDTSAWRCQQQLLNTWNNANGLDTDLLLSILTLIQDLLTPTERILWGAFGPHDEDLDGTFAEREVIAAIMDIRSAAEETECDDSTDITDLHRFRTEALEEAVSKLFRQPGMCCKDGVVAFSDVLNWWVHLSEEYRTALGLVLTKPIGSLQAAAIFSHGLARMSRGRGARTALRRAVQGQCRLLADLRVRAVCKISGKFKLQQH